jgi:DNA-binding transcriptional MerR regulator
VDGDLLKIGELARSAGVPIATLKHYVREGLIKPACKTGRTMSWYAPSSVARVRAIKDLQQEQFLPLDVIRESLAGDAAASDDLTAADAIAKVLERHTGPKTRTREQLIERGVSPKDLDWLAAAGLARPGADGRYRGDDLALLSTLGAARKAGITAEMLPFSILGDYLAALRALIEIELRLFREGVLPRARKQDVSRLTTSATELSERLVVVMRRKLLLPVMERQIEEDSHEEARGDRRGRGVRRKQSSGQRRGRRTRGQ